jgi:DNA replication protein DnaC
MSLSVVKNRMLELGFQGMLPALESVLDRLQKGELHVTEGIDLLLEHEWRFRQERATSTRKVRSKIRKGAALEEFDLSFSRGLTKADLRQLAKLEWCEQGKPLILVGPTGIGKSYIARSLGLLACERGKTALFLSVTDFLDLRDVIEHRSYGKSTVITTQLPADHWSEVMGDEIIRDALIERLQPAANTILMQGPGYRAESAKKMDKGAARK